MAAPHPSNTANGSSTVRLATLADASAMAAVFAAGFIDDDVFGRFMHPHRHTYPADWLQYWERDMRRLILQPSSRPHVITNSAGIIKGCVMLQRIGPKGTSALENAESYARRAQRLLVAGQDYVSSLLAPDKSADVAAMATFDANWEDIAQYFSGKREECWMIELLCIHPDSQGMGYGRKLVNAAVEVCEGEEPKLPLAVIASEIGDAFYEKMGFREVGRANVGGLSGVKGGSLKFLEGHVKR
jgi:GNAT superfamily N-acetyltransferase